MKKKTEETTHTPLPWPVSQQAGYISVGPLMVTNDNQVADAAFVVRAVKLHETLLAALKEVSNAANICAASDSVNAAYWFAKQRIVNTTLKQVEGE